MVQATRKGYSLHAVVSLLFPRCIAKLGKIFGSRDTHQSNWTARSPACFYFSHKKLYYRRIYFLAAGSAATSTFRALHPWFLSLPFSPVPFSSVMVQFKLPFGRVVAASIDWCSLVTSSRSISTYSDPLGHFLLTTLMFFTPASSSLVMLSNFMLDSTAAVRHYRSRTDGICRLE